MVTLQLLLWLLIQVLGINEGQPECILQDLNGGCIKPHGVYSAHMEFNIKLLSLIEEDMEKEYDSSHHVLAEY